MPEADWRSKTDLSVEDVANITGETVHWIWNWHETYFPPIGHEEDEENARGGEDEPGDIWGRGPDYTKTWPKRKAYRIAPQTVEKFMELKADWDADRAAKEASKEAVKLEKDAARALDQKLKDQERTSLHINKAAYYAERSGYWADFWATVDLHRNSGAR